MTLADFSHFDIKVLEGCSVIGRNHVAIGLPNQDAVGIWQFEKGNILAVADGVGSDHHSEMASQSAVEAVIEVFTKVSEHELEVDDIADALCFTFKRLLSEKFDRNASTTCIFCAHLYDMGVFLGQIGDGICCGFQNGAPFIFKEKNADFTNIVEPLTPDCPSDRWKIFHMDSPEVLELMLATDGIADDILPGKETAFAHHLIEVIEKSTANERHEVLEEILTKWETPRSYDDKTVLIYHCTFMGGRNEYSKHATVC